MTIPDLTNKSRTILFWSIILCGLALRTVNLGKFSIWYDEKVSLLNAYGIDESESIESAVLPSEWIAKHGLDGVDDAMIANTGGNALLYHYALHYWTKIAGDSDFAIRFLSVIFGMLLLIPVYSLSKKITGSEITSLLVLCILCFHPLLIEFSREAKCYSMATFFSAWSTLQFFRFKENTITVKSGLFYSVLCICTLLSHYFALYVLLLHVALFFAWHFPINRLPRLLMCASLVLIVMLSWYISGGRDGLRSMAERNARYSERAMNYTEGADPFVMPSTISNISKGWVQVLMPISGNQLQKLGFRLREVLILLILPILIFAAGWKFRNRSQQVYGLLWIVPIYLLLMTLLSIKSGHCISFQPLYSQFTVAFVAIVFAQALTDTWNKVSQKLILPIVAGWAGIMLVSTSTSIFDLGWDPSPREKNPILSLADQCKSTGQVRQVVFGNARNAQLFAIYMRDTNTEIATDPELGEMTQIIYSDGKVEEQRLEVY